MAKTVFKSTGRKLPPDYTITFEAGELIFTEGELGTEMFIVHEGQVEIFKVLQEKEQPLALLEKGDFFGEMAILEDLPRTATARAVTDCRLLKINGSTFDQMLRTNPEIGVRMMRKLSRRLRQTDMMLKEALGSAAPVVDGPPPSAPVAVKPAAQKLVHLASGMEFHLAEGSETLIGRKDPVTGIVPDVDLTPVDGQRSTSRRHAKVFRQAGKFFLAEEIGTMNGTFINGQRLETGVPVAIQPGDELQVGLVKLAFQEG